MLDKAYVDEEFTKEMKSRGVNYIAIKRDNMVKDEAERQYYTLSKVRRIIETRFS